VTLTADLERNNRIRALIDELLAQPRLLGPDYQPIVRLDDAAVVGYKATGRGQPGTELGDTLSLLAGAQSLGLVERLDWTFRALAFEDFTGFAGRDEVELQLTPEPETYGTLCPPRLAAGFARAKATLRVGAEVHASAFDGRYDPAKGVAEVRSWGWRVIVADLSDHPAALERVAALSPDVVQVDVSRPGVGAGAPGSGLGRLLTVAAEAGAELMAVGVDDAAAKARAIALGCRTGRGAFLGRPAQLPAA
jgi:EAL domain-containing protein (putative c-di-GMP-specific phosphodiesterase class I)